MQQQHPPVSQQFDDVYFSAHGGLAEVQHVFHTGNNLAARFAACQQQGDTFTIGELGFGTGLSYAATVQLWQQAQHQQPANQQNNAKLVFVSVEKFPLEWSDMVAALTPWPAVLALLTPLAETYQQHSSANQPTWLTHEQDNITLKLGLGDVADILPDYPSNINAWFLDGFTPAKNPAMWTPEVLQYIAQKTMRSTTPHLNGTCATFTAASAVRRGLQENGFHMQKCKGFAFKREMLMGNM